MGNFYVEKLDGITEPTGIIKTIKKEKKSKYVYPMKNAYPILMRNFMKHLENST